ncbi:MAG TPA: hypothetical protein VF981_05260 [Gemmatimonadaceae bacterium]
MRVAQAGRQRWRPAAIVSITAVSRAAGDGAPARPDRAAWEIAPIVLLEVLVDPLTPAQSRAPRVTGLHYRAAKARTIQATRSVADRSQPRARQRGGSRQPDNVGAFQQPGSQLAPISDSDPACRPTASGAT